MSKKYTCYETAKSYLKDKDKNVNNFIDTMFCKTNEMFTWKNLPETVPQAELEYLLQSNGTMFFTKVGKDFYALLGTLGGQINAYYEPTKYTVANVALNLSKMYDIEKDGVLIRNDLRCNGLIPILSKYASMLTDCEISLNTMSILMRVMFLISASDDKTKKSAEEFMSKIINGNYSIIADSQFFDGIKAQGMTQSFSQLIPQMIELTQYIKASALNEIGLNANYNMKKERITEQEYTLNIDALMPFAENMLNCRKKAVEKINKMYGLNIEVSLNSVWETNQAELESETTLADMKNGTDSITEKPVTNEKSADTDIEEKTDTEKTDTGTETETEKTDTGTETETEKSDNETEKSDNETEKSDNETEMSDNETADDKKEKEEK
jgi:hypothetical protein